jgi:hypothetical protein
MLRKSGERGWIRTIDPCLNKELRNVTSTTWTDSFQLRWNATTALSSKAFRGHRTLNRNWWAWCLGTTLGTVLEVDPRSHKRQAVHREAKKRSSGGGTTLAYRIRKLNIPLRPQ